MMLLDGFHGVFLALYIESSPFCIPLWQQLALSLSKANGFLTESPQVVYLFVEVKRKQCGQDKDLFSPLFIILWQTAGNSVLNI